jgi:hypothetical protein
MRTKSTKQYHLVFSGKSRQKVVNECREKDECISQLPGDNPRLVALAHRDPARMLSQSKGECKSGWMSEPILRSLIVMCAEQDSHRQLVVRIENSDFLRYY